MALTRIHSDKSYKILKANIPGGEKMPTHYASSNAFIIVFKGEAEVIFTDGETVLHEGTTLLIPAGRPHALQVKKDFEAYIVLAGDGEIEFAGQVIEKSRKKEIAF